MLYLHVPFCRKACTYCDFHFSTNLSKREEMAAAIAWEIEARKDFFGPTSVPFKTVYLGGGTPSVFEADELALIFDAIHRNFAVAREAEITLEANPDDLSTERLQNWRNLGVNRLSVGVQSFRPEDLRWMNRSHAATEIDAALGRARSAGFDNFSLDLIFGLPDWERNTWRDNLDRALALAPAHLSLYALTVSERTALHHQVRQDHITLPDDADVERQYLYAHQRLEKAGFEHYELSSFARPGKRSRHNGSYWEGKPYLGVGPSAHSFDGTTRSWNIANNAHYLRAIAEQQLPRADAEILSKKDQYNEFMLTQLRRIEGISPAEVEFRFGVDIWAQYGDRFRDWHQRGWLWQRSGRIGFSPAGWIRSDGLIAELFWE